MSTEWIESACSSFLQHETRRQGHDTTAATMTWFLHCISLHPDEQEKLFDELDRVFGDDTERPCTMQDCSQLKYLECCIKETLRLYPSAPFVARRLTEDVQIGQLPFTDSNMVIILRVVIKGRCHKYTSQPERGVTHVTSQRNKASALAQPGAFLWVNREGKRRNSKRFSPVHHFGQSVVKVFSFASPSLTLYIEVGNTVRA